MRELDIIISRYSSLKSQHIPCVLATVVHVDGSSYRRPGARMLVDEYGNITGAISGGCLEGDALRKALYALDRQENKLVTYDTSDEDDAVIGAQLGCNGIIQVLFEPIDYTDQHNPCELLRNVIEKEVPVAISVVFDLDKSQKQLGTISVADIKDAVAGKPIPDDLQKALLLKSKEVINKGNSCFGVLEINGKKYYIFIQMHLPPVNLVLVGAGNDAQILAQQAELLGWNVVVTDGRPTHANKDRFVGACQVIVTKPEETLASIKIDQRTCFVLMSHNYNYDLSVLKLLLGQSEIPYIGILGPLKKYNRMLNELADEGVEVSKADLSKIHAPVGLEIGAETPAEIGLSILAEIQSVLKNKTPRPLKQKNEPIHNKEQNKFQKISI
ncbi:XdhC/CoxI family protein [Flagellimonas halotolerans]|uniref:XdhC/CoxI family protein n=1 Tax=Flagellimonas halotolerans TaxID=3112164 RepID=A0ABU6ITI4_9FLAO|nr:MULTISPECIES: XdhC/CoxI family protein [unclassified Allomuricauda]MEC3966589.1 XdhC/CoxI family protein [Muricauda sp. SYSU M86414]MEC4266438.1 XdhC/CoxI family protein [Muricauda sp. SYSU M84420]